MSRAITIETSGTQRLDVTPERLGEIFASMGSDEQARFFAGVHEAMQEWPKSPWSYGGYGEPQWYDVARQLRGDEMKDARITLMAMAAPLYRFCEPAEVF